MTPLAPLAALLPRIDTPAKSRAFVGYLRDALAATWTRETDRLALLGRAADPPPPPDPLAARLAALEAAARDQAALVARLQARLAEMERLADLQDLVLARLTEDLHAQE